MNTFQGILITNGQLSYAVFTYKCGLMSWSGDASIGFNTNGQFFYNHYFSLTPNASLVSCINSVWTNMVYQLCKWRECHWATPRLHIFASNIQMVLSFTLLNLDRLLKLVKLQYLMDLLKPSIFQKDSLLEHLLNILFLYVDIQYYMPVFACSLPLNMFRSTAMDICLLVEV